MIVYLFVVGAAFGSFALVLAERMHAGRDWVRGRSECDHCGTQLKPFDLVPILSWVVQRGRCRYCSRRLSPAYPLIEVALGASFAISYAFVPYELSGYGLTMFVLWLSGLVLMAALVVTDLKWYLLLNKLVYPLAALALVHRIVSFMSSEQALLDASVATAAALAVGSGLFWLLHHLSGGKWIGDGDYRLGLAIGLYLGDPLLVWVALFFASLSGLVVAIPALVRSTQPRKQIKIPFGPFLIVGLGVAYLFGADAVDWYQTTFLYL